MPTLGPLHLRIHDADGERTLHLEGASISAGRDPDCGLRLEDLEISRLHGRFEHRLDGWYYTDAGSQNGSILNGEQLESESAHVLQAGDVLHIGSVIIHVMSIQSWLADDTSAPFAALQSSDTLVMSRAALGLSELSASDSAGTRGSPLGGAPAGVEVFVSAGRAMDNDIVLTDPYISGHHLEAWLQDGQLYVHDMASRNGTFLGGEPFAHGVVSPDATLRLGVETIVHASELLRRLLSGPQPSMYLRKQSELDHLLVGQGLGRMVGHGKVILRDVDISVRAGQFVAIAGASGAGKTTLMKVLNGYTLPDTGVVTVAPNGAGGAEIGYVPQDDIISRELPLRDALVLSAILRYPPRTPTEVVAKRADEVMTELGLSESASTLVARLSGGQRKRASVALELMTNPRLLLLDEPTSGLDPASDRRLIRLLRALADSGFGIVLITHTTANIAACDTVAFLAPGGYLVFWGSPEAAKQYFGTDNLEEVYEDLENAGTPQVWRQRFLQSDEYRHLREEEQVGLQQLEAAARQGSEPAPQSTAGTALWQLRGLSRRYLRTLLADRRNLVLLLIQIPVILLLARLIFAYDVLLRINRSIPLPGTIALPGLSVERVPVVANATPGMNLLFVIATTLVWLGTINAAREICKELPIWERERHVGVHTIPYVLSKILVLGGLCAVQTFLLLVLMLMFWAVPGGPGSWLGILLTGFLASLSGVAIGLSISAAVSTTDRAVALVPIVMIPQIMFGGTVIPLSSIGTAGQAISALIGARWAFEAVGRFTNRAAYLPVGSPFEDAVSGSAIAPVLALLVLALVFGCLALLLVSLGEGEGRVLARIMRRPSRADKAGAAPYS